jgi:hypothetical protein
MFGECRTMIIGLRESAKVRDLNTRLNNLIMNRLLCFGELGSNPSASMSRDLNQNQPFRLFLLPLNFDNTFDTFKADRWY